MAKKPTYEELEERVKQLEKEVVESCQAKKKLQESEEKFRNIYEESPTGIELYDSYGLLLDVNKACLDIFGISDVKEVKGFDLFEDLDPKDEFKEKLRKGETVR